MNNNVTMFGLNLGDGRIKGYPVFKKKDGTSNNFYVLYVRNNTGYGQNVFSSHNGIVTDSASGLMWDQDDSCLGYNWSDALAWVEQKNNENYKGYNDWRLPNAKELHSLVDYSRSPETSSSAAIDPVFNITSITNEAGLPDYPFFWTSTSHINEKQKAGSAVYICFGKASGFGAE
jgi:hypothetical protein